MFECLSAVSIESSVSRRLVARIAALIAIFASLAGCASAPPKQQHNLCAVFAQHPSWYDYARESAATWGTPIPIQMAFVRHESSYRENAKPPFEWFLFIPLGRASSAKGYAQIQDPAWQDYRAERGSLFRSRGDMEDALDFIGWYNDKTHRQLGISKWNAEHLYLAYHEGRGGYRRGSYKRKPKLRKIAARVAATASEYGAQLKQCEQRFRCRKLWQFGPFCS